MKKAYAAILLVFLTIGIIGQTIKPDVLASSGGWGESQDVMLCWTVGEAFTNGLSQNNFTLQQGFHQGFLTIVSHIDNVPENIQISVYPNPVNQFLKIGITGGQPFESWSVKVFNSEGKLIILQPIKSGTTDIDFSSYPSAGYLVKIFEKQGHFKVFNIIKK